MSTPLFIEDISVAKRSKLQSLLQQLSGPSCGTRHFNQTESIGAAVAATAPGCFDPIALKVAKDLGYYHPLVVWKRLKIAIIPGPGCYGRTVSVHYGWVPPGIASPKTVGEFANLPGYTMRVFGGVADPNFNGSWEEAPFDEQRHAVIHSGLLAIAIPMRLAWYVEEADIGAKTGTGARCFIRFEGEMEVFGQFY